MRAREGPPAVAATIAARAKFDQVRYAQVWEDADVLLAALDPAPGATLVSIASAGDNALALLTRDPARVIAIDLSAAQLACVKLRLAAYAVLDHPGLLELMGSRPSRRRGTLLDACLARLDPETAAFWEARRTAVIAHGAAGVGRFERYFRIFRRFVLPFTHLGRARELLAPRDPMERLAFYHHRWNNRRWQLAMRAFFSRSVMGRIGRDPAFFAYVDGDPAEHVARRLLHAGVTTDPSANPYLHWILTGTHGAALPFALRPEHFSTIRDRLDRIELRLGPIESVLDGCPPVDGFGLSDIFEYMDVAAFHVLIERLIGVARPGARLVYWNMMAPRRAAEHFPDRLRRLEPLEQRLRQTDNAFFYSDLVIEERLE